MKKEEFFAISQKSVPSSDAISMETVEVMEKT